MSGPILNYGTGEVIENLNQFKILLPCDERKKFLQSLLESGEYDLRIVCVPANEEDTRIKWKQTYRDHISTPEGSILVAIMASAQPV